MILLKESSESIIRLLVQRSYSPHFNSPMECLLRETSKCRGVVYVCMSWSYVPTAKTVDSGPTKAGKVMSLVCKLKNGKCRPRSKANNVKWKSATLIPR